MPIIDNTKKKFVIKHVFKDVESLIIDKGDGAEISGPVEKHFGVKWKLRLYNCQNDDIDFCLDCLHDKDSCDWSIETEHTVLKEGYALYGVSSKFTFTKDDPSDWQSFRISSFVCSPVSIEFHVTIKKMTGIKKKVLKAFDDDLAKESSDIVLKIGDQKFYVNKMYLGFQSSYFKSLFSQSFAESQKSEIELKDIDPEHFQDFLELIHGVSLVKDYTVSGILKLADYLDVQIALQRCEEFLMKYSKRSLAEKFGMSIKYKMENLKSKCLGEMKNSDDVIEAIPIVSDFHENCVYKELLDKMISFK